MKKLLLIMFSLVCFFGCSDKEKQQEIVKLETETLELKNAISKTKDALEKLETTENEKAETLKKLDMVP